MSSGPSLPVGNQGRLLDDVPATPQQPFMPPNGGPLSDRHAGTFTGGHYDTSASTEPMRLYRAGIADRPLGGFFSSEPPVGVTQARIDEAIPEVWPDGTPAPWTPGTPPLPGGHDHAHWCGGEPRGIYMGGTEQVLVERPWEIPGAGPVDSWPLR